MVDAVAGNLDKLKAMIAYDGVVDRGTLILQTRTLIAASGEMMFEAGKRLLVLKETLEHGDFQKALSEIGIEYHTAIRFMNATLKLGSGSKVTTLSLLPKSKIYELAALDDDYLKELNDNGTVAGLELDEYDRMTTRELRAKVRELNEKMHQKEESFERLMKIEQDTRQKLADDLHRMESLDPRHRWSEDAKQVNLDLLTLTGEIIERMGRAFDLADRVLALKESEFSTAQFNAVKNLQSLCEQLGEYAENFGMKVDEIIPDGKPGLEGYDVLSEELDS